MEARGGWQVHFSDTPYSPSLLRQGLSLNQKFVVLTKWADQQASGIFLPPLPVLHTMPGLQAHCYIQSMCVYML